MNGCSYIEKIILLPYFLAAIRFLRQGRDVRLQKIFSHLRIPVEWEQFCSNHKFSNYVFSVQVKILSIANKQNMQVFLGISINLFSIDNIHVTDNV